MVPGCVLFAAQGKALFSALDIAAGFGICVLMLVIFVPLTLHAYLRKQR
ncbi:hypothetical protein [Xylanibacillus composti]|nr:hypothetical protein [Xylanibacillus composti]